MSHFPLTANGPYDRFGNTYNVSKILQADDRFNETAYAEYSPLYLPATYAMTYFLGFAVMTCILVHTVLYHGRTLLNGLKKIPVEPDDIHAKLMRNYPEVPDWWYLSVFLVCFSLGIVAIEVSPYLLHMGVCLILCEGLAHIGPYIYPIIGLHYSNTLYATQWFHIRNDWPRSAYTFACMMYPYLLSSADRGEYTEPNSPSDDIAG